jgi:hypothetical protein
MKIAFDLEGTLLPEYGEFPTESAGFFAHGFFDQDLRMGAPALLRSLALRGHRVVLYTLSGRSSWQLMCWLWCQGVPVWGVINRRTHVRRLQQCGQDPYSRKRPDLFGIDLFVDDDPVTAEGARIAGCATVLVLDNGGTAGDFRRAAEDWTLMIRLAVRFHSRPWYALGRHRPMWRAV